METASIFPAANNAMSFHEYYLLEATGY